LTVPGVPREPSSSRPLPNGWRWVKLGDVCHEDRHLVEPGSNDAAELTCYGLEHVEAETGCILKRSRGQVEDEGKSATFRFDGRHVLYGKLRPYLNKVALPYSPGRCTTEMIPLLPHDGVDREFLAWLLRRRDTVDFAMLGKTGSRMPRADMGSLMNLVVPLPPADQQGRIAVLLREQMAAVERARVAAITRLEAVKTLPATFLREVFPNPGQDLPDGWRWVRLGEMAKTTSGSTPSRSQPMYYGGDIPWVKTGELRDGYVERTDENITRQALAECSLSLLPPGTLLVAMYGQGQTRGRTGLLSIHATTNQACFAILPNEQEFIPLYLQAWFWHSYDRIREETEGRGGNQPNLNGQILKQMVVPLPTLVEQGQIAARLRDQMATIEKARAAAEAELHTINVLPAALLRRAFRAHIGTK